MYEEKYVFNFELIGYFCCSGVSVITHRQANANNERTEDGYNPDHPKSFLLYLDANNLYGFAMQQPLPTGGFRWLDPIEFDDITSKIQSIDVDSPIGYVLEVDLHYPSDLHDEHNDYPLAPEKLVVTEAMLSPYCKSFFDEKPYRGDKKLVPNLLDKTKYAVHYRNLQLYLELGMQLKKVHRILAFTQERWLAQYIDLNTQLRQQASSDFEKDLYKLANNSVYGMFDKMSYMEMFSLYM